MANPYPQGMQDHLAGYGEHYEDGYDFYYHHVYSSKRLHVDHNLRIEHKIMVKFHQRFF